MDAGDGLAKYCVAQISLPLDAPHVMTGLNEAADSTFGAFLRTHKSSGTMSGVLMAVVECVG